MPPLFEPSASAIDELVVARDALEAGTLLMVKMKDNERFERNFSQLKAYYADTRCGRIVSDVPGNRCGSLADMSVYG